MKKRILTIVFILFCFSPSAKACYGEFCATGVGILYDYPQKYYNKYTRPEYIDPRLILNDPQAFLEQNRTKLPIKACQKGKKKCSAAIRL